MIEVTRMAPSPTGRLHLGTIKSIIFTWLWSRQNGASFIFRIDDTDQKRCKDEYLKEINRLLQTYKIVPTKTFKQSERSQLYDRILQKCIEQGLVYTVTETEEELKKRQAAGEVFKKGSIKPSDEQAYYRFNIGQGPLIFKDEFRGEIKINLSKISDPVIQKPSGEFTYSFASIVDDLQEGVTMVIRGCDHLDNTAVQVAMMRKMIEAGIFTDRTIRFAHYPLFLFNGQKLSKRVSTDLAIMERFHPIAIANYLVLMGSGGRRFYNDLEEMVEVFKLQDHIKSNTINFDLKQIEGYQQKALSRISLLELNNWVKTSLTEAQWLTIRENVLTADISLWERVFNDQNLTFAACSPTCEEDKFFLRMAITGQVKGPRLEELFKVMDEDIVKRRIKNFHPIQIFLRNSLSKAVERFFPIDKSHVKMYCCGPTIHCRPHIGNYRCFVVFDLLFRLLLALYQRVSYVRNITDVNDKILARAKAIGHRPKELMDDICRKFSKDQQFLRILKPTLEPRVSHYMKDIIQAIEKMLHADYAYIQDKKKVKVVSHSCKSGAEGRILVNDSYPQESEGGVYFREDKVQNYDLFSIKGESSDQGDFALWRNNKIGDMHEWESPWGVGCPGWHTECVVMIEKTLGIPLDIHAGGKDLIFPHHTNEAAQATALGQNKLANYWLHSEFINVGDEKMSKSAENGVDLSNIQTHGCVIRLVLIKTHYLDPLTWSEDGLLEALNMYNKWRRVLGNFLIRNKIHPPIICKGFIIPEVLEALAKNLNLPLALRVLDRNVELLEKDPRNLHLYLDLITSFELVGVDFDFKYVNSEEIIELVALREKYKKEKDFKEADKVRDILKSRNIELQDSPSGTLWYENAQ